MYEIYDWTLLTSNLSYLAAPAEKFGVYQFEDRIIDFLRGMSESDRFELISLMPQTSKDSAAIDTWIDQHEITKYPEARLVYFFLL